MTPHPNEVSIVLVEDDDGHARLIEKNLVRAGFQNPLLRFREGKSALQYLTVDWLEQSSKKPLLVLLDLNLPVYNGYQIVEKMKSNPKTKNIPIVILTTTSDHREVEKCYELGCNVYITKPVDYGQFIDAIRKLGLFLTIVQLP